MWRTRCEVAHKHIQQSMGRKSSTRWLTEGYNFPIWKKKGSKRECEKYRGISLLSHTGKMYAKILEKRIRPIVEYQLMISESQFGLRKNRECRRWHLWTFDNLCLYCKRPRPQYPLRSRRKLLTRSTETNFGLFFEDYGVKRSTECKLILLTQHSTRCRVPYKTVTCKKMNIIMWCLNVMTLLVNIIRG